MHRPTFEAHLRSHFEHRASAEEDDPSWYALRNTIYASGCRLFLAKDHSTSFLDAQVQAWQYFENALSVITELEFSPTGLSAVQALTVMVSATPLPCFHSNDIPDLYHLHRPSTLKDLEAQPLSTCFVPTRRDWLSRKASIGNHPNRGDCLSPRYYRGIGYSGLFTASRSI